MVPFRVATTWCQGKTNLGRKKAFQVQDGACSACPACPWCRQAEHPLPRPTGLSYRPYHKSGGSIFNGHHWSHIAFPFTRVARVRATNWVLSPISATKIRPRDRRKASISPSKRMSGIGAKKKTFAPIRCKSLAKPSQAGKARPSGQDVDFTLVATPLCCKKYNLVLDSISASISCQ